MMSFFGSDNGGENKYPIELLNEDIDRMINSDEELINAFNALKTAELSDVLEKDTACETVVEFQYGYDTEDNKYPLELLNEDIDRMLNSEEFINALNALKTKMEKDGN